jgi:hypothetical protein
MMKYASAIHAVNLTKVLWVSDCFEGPSLFATQAQTHHLDENRSGPTQLNFQCVQAHVGRGSPIVQH